MSYNSDGLPESVSIIGLTDKLVEYEYDAMSRPKKLTYGNGTVKNASYDSITGNLLATGYNGSYPYTYSYNADGSLSYQTDT